MLCTLPCTLDHLGNHAVTCKYYGDVVSRHNRIRDIDPGGDLSSGLRW